MESLFLAVLFGASSILLFRLVLWRSRPSRRLLGASMEAMTAFAGLWLLCLALNLTVGALGVIAIRGLTPLFVSIYLVNDVSVVFVSALQAFVLHVWLSASRQ